MLPLARGSWRRLLPRAYRQCVLGSKVSFLKGFPSILPCLRPKFSKSDWRPFYPGTASEPLSPILLESIETRRNVFTDKMREGTGFWKPDSDQFGSYQSREILRPDHRPDWIAQPPVSPLSPHLSSFISVLTSIPGSRVPFHFHSVG